MKVSSVYRILFIVVLVSTGSVAAHATRLYGLGAQTCATFDTQYRNQPALTEVVYYSWYQGFLSSTNLALHADGKRPVDYDATVAITQDDEGFLRDYCALHPDQQFIRAVLQLIKNYQDKFDRLDDRMRRH